jgi:hypothetical protein
MAFTITSQTNLAYNERVEGVPGDQLARVGLSQGFSGDLAAKAFAPWRDPQFRFVCTTTTAADTGSFTLNMFTSTRTVNDPLSSGSLQNTLQLGPLAGLGVAGSVRPLRVRVTQKISATVAHVFWFQVTCIGGATPVVLEPAVASKAQLGTRRAADDDVTFTEGASSLVVTVTHGTGNANVTWTVDVFTDDQL